MNTFDPHHWTLNTCFGAFLLVWVHLQPFRYYTKLEAKRGKLVQLMQQFVPRCFLRIFHNERSRSTPLDSTLMFLCISFRSRAFGTVLLLHETCYKTRQTVQLMQKFVPRCLVRIFRNKRSRSTPLDPKLMFLCISFRSRAFGTVLLLHETCCKTRQTGAINANVPATMSC